MISEKLASDAALYEVLCICPGCRPIETYMEGLAYKGPSCGMVAAESGMNFCQNLTSFLFGDAPLEHSGRAFLVEFPFVDFVSFRTLYYKACFILVFVELLPIK